jgi:hypothetical protein
LEKKKEERFGYDTAGVLNWQRLTRAEYNDFISVFKTTNSFRNLPK